MSKEYQFYDAVSIRSDGYVLCKKSCDYIPRKDVSEESLKNLKDSKVKGKMSESSRRRVRKILDNWISSVYYYRWSKHINYDNNLPLITAITLTIPNVKIKSDKEIKKDLLSVYFIYLKRYCKVKNYFWKAEMQKNGSIHFHVLIDRFVPKEKINKYWNESLKRHGYLKEYFKKYGNWNPPSARIEKLRSKTGAISYFIKYALKDEENGFVSGKIYGLSDELRELRNISLIVTYEIAENLKNGGMITKNRKIKEKYYSFYRHNVYSDLKSKKDLLSYYYTSYLAYIFDSLYGGAPYNFNEYVEIYDNNFIVE